MNEVTEKKEEASLGYILDLINFPGMIMTPIRAVNEAVRSDDNCLCGPHLERTVCSRGRGSAGQ